MARRGNGMGGEGARTDASAPPDDWDLLVLGLDWPKRAIGVLGVVTADASPWRRLVWIDARARLGEPPMDDLAAVTADVAGTPDESLLGPWAQAVAADFGAGHFDVAAMQLAEAALGGITDSPFPPRVVLQARGRLRRLVAMTRLIRPDPVPAADRLYEEAVADFRRCGLDDQADVTSSLYLVQRLLVLGADPEVAAVRVAEARDALAARRSPWQAMAEAGLALLYYVQEDLPAAERALDACTELLANDDGTHLPALMVCFVAPLRAMCQVWVAGPGSRADDELAAAIEDMRRQAPFLVGLMLHLAADLYADLGDRRRAVEYFTRTGAVAIYGWADEAARRRLGLRLALLGGDRSAVAPLVDEVAAMAAAGRPTAAAVLARKAGTDCRRIGDGDGAAALREARRRAMEAHASARPAVAGRRRRTTLGDPGHVARSAGAGEAPGPVDGAVATVRLMAPSVMAWLGERPVTLPEASSRLLAVLLTRTAPVAVEQLIDLLWPDVPDVPSGRRRLASSLHRLRALFGLGRDGLVARQGQVLRVTVPAGWAVDVVDLRAAVHGNGTEARLGAVLEVTGAVASTQFPYDEALVDARHRLVADWTTVARDLLARGALKMDDLAHQLAALELDASVVDGVPAGEPVARL